MVLLSHYCLYDEAGVLGFYFRPFLTRFSSEKTIFKFLVSDFDVVGHMQQLTLRRCGVSKYLVLLREPRRLESIDVQVSIECTLKATACNFVLGY